MTDQPAWQRETAIRKVREEQQGENPPPIATSYAAAARYVGASPADVERWWKGRGA